MRKNLTIGIVGAGGDGVVVLGSLLQRIGAALGYFSQMPRYYGAQIRGGGSAVKLGLDAERLSLPKDSMNVFVCFSWGRYLEFKREMALRADTLVTYENDLPEGMKLPRQCFRIDFTRRSQEVTGSTRNKNIVALGLLKAILALLIP
jgi:Pyruvate/2-oxoacid:ferredoxin oxidoreductase gamma subunit